MFYILKYCYIIDGAFITRTIWLCMLFRIWWNRILPRWWNIHTDFGYPCVTRTHLVTTKKRQFTSPWLKTLQLKWSHLPIGVAESHQLLMTMTIRLGYYNEWPRGLLGYTHSHENKYFAKMYSGQSLQTTTNIRCKKYIAEIHVTKLWMSRYWVENKLKCFLQRETQSILVT